MASTTPAPMCAQPGCRRPTASPSGRCQDHRSASASSLSPADLVSRISFPPTPSGPDDDLGATPIRFRDGRGHETEEWRAPGGWLHRVGGPAITKRNPNTGHISYEAYYRADARHRTDGPTLRIFNDNGSIRRESFYLYGRQASIGPKNCQAIGYTENGVVKTYSFAQETPGPIVMRFDPATGERAPEQDVWLIAGYRARTPDVPSIIADDAELSDEDAAEWVRGSKYFNDFLSAGLTPERLVSLLRSGMKSREMLLGVATGTTPHEWALAFDENTTREEARTSWAR